MKTVNRLLYLDLMRGLAAVVMLQGHVFHSFLRNDLRTGGPYVFSQFVGGMPPAVFLFLTGITLAFLMSSQERRGLSPMSRWAGALRRAGYLLLVAYLFRIQLWVFTRMFSETNSPWTEMLKVDILNCMGFGIGLMAILAMFNTKQRVRICALLGCGIAFVSPWVTQTAGAAWWPSLLRDYIVPNANYFSFFPWAAFIAFGLSFGSFLRLLKPEQVTGTMQWVALSGIALAFGGDLIADPISRIYSKSDFWLDSPALAIIKVGILFIVISFCYVWMMQPAAQRWSWIRQLGVTSLLVYWVHIELVYGSWLGWFKTNLNVQQTIVVAAAVIALMVGLSYLRTSWPQLKVSVLDFFAPPQPQRVSGD